MFSSKKIFFASQEKKSETYIVVGNNLGEKIENVSGLVYGSGITPNSSFTVKIVKPEYKIEDRSSLYKYGSFDLPSSDIILFTGLSDGSGSFNSTFSFPSINNGTYAVILSYVDNEGAKETEAEIKVYNFNQLVSIKDSIKNFEIPTCTAKLRCVEWSDSYAWALNEIYYEACYRCLEERPAIPGEKMWGCCQEEQAGETVLYDYPCPAYAGETLPYSNC